ncbi:TetR/AcrR family transcriptional regulator [Actinocatenispora sera]|jgi:AcrR family transcriptional regulator|uniref:TetR family transcriptional regulator n=1 Tax=Actinocatenispora sera TaxID=390989 RepID=A0A810L9B3_9ACTN|nr:TetR/AcrR family transcriptional regulator [Actinocatenispora sera]BCJ31182.1 TetR family transcriptional regulator [Actinocatenispora sera]
MAIGAERADAARNRAAILRATEELLAREDAEHVSVDAVAAAAGVGKGTVFRRFGSRAGLLRALVDERMDDLSRRIRTGPPPLGPGAPAVERLTAFFDAVVDVASRNSVLISAYEYAAAGPQRSAAAQRAEPEDHDATATQAATDAYAWWYEHLTGLIAEARPDLDAELVGHVLLGSLHAPPIRTLLADGAAGRVRDTMRRLVTDLLAAPGH